VTSDNHDPTLERLERELARSLRPASVRGDVLNRVAARLDVPKAAVAARMSLADRVLAAFVGSGAIAACAIVGIVTWNIAGSGANAGAGGGSAAGPTRVVAQQTATQPAEPSPFVFSLGRYPQWLARSSAGGDPLSASR
jgi:hypothetical protein